MYPALHVKIFISPSIFLYDASEERGNQTDLFLTIFAPSSSVVGSRIGLNLMEEQSFGSCSCLLVLQKKRWKWQKESVGRGREDEDEKDAWDLFFDLERLELATDHFSEENLLGRGGFGPVYKVILQMFMGLFV